MAPIDAFYHSCALRNDSSAFPNSIYLLIPAEIAPSPSVTAHMHPSLSLSLSRPFPSDLPQPTKQPIPSTVRTDTFTWNAKDTRPENDATLVGIGGEIEMRET